MGIVKTILWDPFPTMLKIFLIFLMILLIVSILWKIVLSFRQKLLPQIQATVETNTAATATIPVPDVYQQANQAYQNAITFAEKKDFNTANLQAQVAISLLQTMEDTPMTREKLGNKSPAEWIQLIQNWQKTITTTGGISLPSPIQSRVLSRMQRP
jgi:hypothetical protein